jgi:hypothetical protein
MKTFFFIIFSCKKGGLLIINIFQNEQSGTGRGHRASSVRLLQDLRYLGVVVDHTRKPRVKVFAGILTKCDGGGTLLSLVITNISIAAFFQLQSRYLKMEVGPL